MSSAELNEKKLDLIAWIKQISDVNLIAFLDGLKNSRADSDWWHELADIQKKEILQGIKDVDQGKVLSSESFWNKLKND